MFWKGPVFTKTGFKGQGISLESCEIIETLDGEEDGVIVPLFRNCHTHLGDSLARKELPENLSLAELVGPSGWKHKWLAENNLKDSIIYGLKEVISSGTGLIMDFREGGEAGLHLFDDLEYPGTVILLGRPEGNELLPGKNAGISSLVDVENANEIAVLAHEKNGLVGIHHSEDCREDIEPLIDLHPDFVVHMCHASDNDLEKIKEAGISVVVCPRSNAYFGNRAPLEKMISLDLDIGFGTDNGMLCSANMIDEIRFIRKEFKDLSLHSILSIACFGLNDMFNKDGTSTYSNLNQCGWILLSRADGDEYESVFNSDSKVLGIRWRN